MKINILLKVLKIWPFLTSESDMNSRTRSPENRDHLLISEELQCHEILHISFWVIVFTSHLRKWTWLHGEAKTNLSPDSIWEYNNIYSALKYGLILVSHFEFDPDKTSQDSWEDCYKSLVYIGVIFFHPIHYTIFLLTLC